MNRLFGIPVVCGFSITSDLNGLSTIEYDCPRWRFSQLANQLIAEKDLYSFMQKHLKQLSREAYCSAPPVPSSSLRPLRLTREIEASRPRAPIDIECKVEISSIESVEFVAEGEWVLPNTMSKAPFAQETSINGK